MMIFVVEEKYRTESRPRESENPSRPSNEEPRTNEPNQPSNPSGPSTSFPGLLLQLGLRTSEVLKDPVKCERRDRRSHILLDRPLSS